MGPLPGNKTRRQFWGYIQKAKATRLEIKLRWWWWWGGGLHSSNTGSVNLPSHAVHSSCTLGMQPLLHSPALWSSGDPRTFWKIPPASKNSESFRSKYVTVIRVNKSSYTLTLTWFSNVYSNMHHILLYICLFTFILVKGNTLIDEFSDKQVSFQVYLFSYLDDFADILLRVVSVDCEKENNRVITDNVPRVICEKSQKPIFTAGCRASTFNSAYSGDINSLPQYCVCSIGLCMHRSP